MQSPTPAISIRHLSKCYKLGTIGRHTLVDEAQYWWHKIRGRDPREHLSKIGYNPTEKRRVDAEQEGNPEFWALKDVSFDVQPGEVIGIIGSNGAGKSTLLKLLTRITEPTSGEIVIHGRVASLLEVGTGFHPELTGRENVFMNGTILGMKYREIEAKFDEIVAFSELEKFIDTPVKRYSSGMYVRLAFAVAAHLEPEILLVDEVLAVGDAQFQKKCLGKMDDVAKQGRTVIFVSHQMGAVAQLCQRVLLLDHGMLVAIGETERMIETYLDSQPKEPGLYRRATWDASKIQIRQAAAINEFRQPVSEFDWKKKIGVCVELSLPELPSNLVLSISLNDRYERRLFTDEKTCNELGLSQGIQHVEVYLPTKLLTPGAYSFQLALHIPNRHLIDLVEQAIPFHIIDTGSQFTKYGSKEFGVVFVECEWAVAKVFADQNPA